MIICMYVRTYASIISSISYVRYKQRPVNILVLRFVHTFWAPLNYKWLQAMRQNLAFNLHWAKLRSCPWKLTGKTRGLNFLADLRINSHPSFDDIQRVKENDEWAKIPCKSLSEVSHKFSKAHPRQVSADHSRAFRSASIPIGEDLYACFPDFHGRFSEQTGRFNQASALWKAKHRQ